MHRISIWLQCELLGWPLEGLLPLCPVPGHMSCQLGFPWGSVGVLWVAPALFSGVTCGFCPGCAGAGCPQECQPRFAVSAFVPALLPR
ncbi:hypothetical protein Nmel_014837 [Mimus melanotis]